MRGISFICIFLTISVYVSATIQEPDVIWYKGKLLLIDNNCINVTGFCYPLDFCKYKMNWPTKKSGYSTANAKGYIATWEIRSDSLFLIKVQNDDFAEIPLKTLFPESQTINGLFANWYNGNFRIITEQSFLITDKQLRSKGLRLYAIFNNGIIKEKIELNLN